MKRIHELIARIEVHLNEHFPLYALGALASLHILMALMGWWLHRGK